MFIVRRPKCIFNEGVFHRYVCTLEYKSHFKADKTQKDLYIDKFATNIPLDWRTCPHINRLPW